MRKATSQAPPTTQPNMTNGRSLLLRHGKPFSARAVMIRACKHANEMAAEIRNYTSTIEGDMDYKRSNAPVRNNNA